MKGYLHLLILLLGLSVTGCVRDDGSDLDCDRTHILFCYYGDTPDGACRFLDKMENVHLFIYDTDGNLVTNITRTYEELQQYKGVNVNLPDGEYQLVAWTNISANTQIENMQQLRDALLCCAHQGNSTQPHNHDPIYFASKTITVVESEFRDEMMHFVQSHIPIHLHVAGAPAPSKSDEHIRMDVSNINPQMSFSGSCSEATSDYRPTLTYNTATYQYEGVVNAYRFGNQNRIEVALSNGDGSECYKTINLADFLTEHAISVEASDEVSLGIRFRFNNASVEVTPWEEENIDPIQN